MTLRYLSVELTKTHSFRLDFSHWVPYWYQTGFFKMLKE